MVYTFFEASLRRGASADFQEETEADEKIREVNLKFEALKTAYAKLGKYQKILEADIADLKEKSDGNSNQLRQHHEDELTKIQNHMQKQLETFIFELRKIQEQVQTKPMEKFVLEKTAELKGIIPVPR